jgi:hypothetical protein
MHTVMGKRHRQQSLYVRRCYHSLLFTTALPFSAAAAATTVALTVAAAGQQQQPLDAVEDSSV